MFVWVAVALLPSFGSSVQALDEPAVPQISESHRAYLSRVARRAMRDDLLERDMYEPGYVPAGLRSLTAEVVVRIRQDGYLLSAAAGGPAPATKATRDAALGAMRLLRHDREMSIDQVPDLLVELEVVGPAQPIDIEGDWTKPRAVDRFLEPGVHGVVIIGPKQRHRFCPTEVFTSDMTVADSLKSFAQNALSDPSQIAKSKLMRFRSVHWIQPKGGAAIVSLHRGLTVLDNAVVTASNLDNAIASLAAYMAYRQQNSGLFSYQYEPGLNRYSKDENLVRQVGATLALSMHAKWSGESASLAAANTAIRYHLQGLTDIPDVDRGAFIATADKKNKLGLTALLAIAMAEHPEAGRFQDTRQRLVRGMLWLQRPSGMFITAFPPAERIDAQDYFPGEALLALAKQYSLEPSADILGAFDRAILFYRSYFRNAPSPAFVPWQVQAYALMAQQGRRGDYVSYVFELSDWLAQKQLNESNCPWPELWGGIAAYQPGRAGVSTASYLEGFTAALELARVMGDQARISKYERIVRDAARFVMQLQFRQEEAYFVRSPKDVIGGIRTTPSLDLLRIDHAQHALVALIRARQTLFPDER